MTALTGQVRVQVLQELRRGLLSFAAALELAIRAEKDALIAEARTLPQRPDDNGKAVP